MKVSSTQSNFKPFDLALTIESEEEARAMFAIFNHTHNTRLLADEGTPIRGLLQVVKDDAGQYKLHDRATPVQAFAATEMETVYHDGGIIKQESFAVLVERLGAYLEQ